MNHPESSSKHDLTSEHSSQMNVETDTNLTKKKRIVFWIYLTSLLAFLTSFAFLTAYSWTPIQTFIQTDTFYFANQVANQWQNGFITNMLVTNNASCPANYTSAISFKWAGTTFGCFCNISANVSFVLEGYCTPALIQSNCNNIKQQAATTASLWKNSSKICLKRSSVSFANQQKYNGINQLCGSSQSLTVMPASEPCPLVNISFSAFSLEDHFSILPDPTNQINPIYVSFNSTSPYSFYSYPLSKFAVSQYQFCQIDSDSGIDPSDSDFILLNTLRGCASSGNYTQLDSMTEIDFYATNPNLQALVSLNGFPAPGNWQYLFGFSSLAGWTYKCRHTYNSKFSIPNAIIQLNFTFNEQYTLLQIGLVVSFVLIVVEIFSVGLNRCIKSAVYPIGYKQRYLLKHFCLALFRYIIDGLCKLTILGISSTCLYLIYTNYNWFKSAINLNCADGNITTIRSILIPFMNLYTTLFNYFLAMVVITFVMLAVDIVHFVYIYKAELTFYLMETQSKLIVSKDQEEDIKWIQIKDQPLQQNQENDEFRITMAQNIFHSPEQQFPKVSKKKKKKFSPFKKLEQEEPKADNQNQVNLEFNPYFIEENNAENQNSKRNKINRQLTASKKK